MFYILIVPDLGKMAFFVTLHNIYTVIQYSKFNQSLSTPTCFELS